MAVPTDIRLDGSVLDGVAINATLGEASVSGTLIGRLTATDADAGDSFSFTLLDDAGGAVFLDGNQLRLSEGAVLDASQPDLTVTVRVQDSTGNQITRVLVVDVTNHPLHQVIRGTAAGETLDSTAPGRDYVVAGAGDDTISADLQDVIVLTGARSDYQISVTTTGGDPYGGDGYGGGGSGDTEITITDLRAGGPDGSDLVLNAGFFRFADGDYALDDLTSTLGTGLALNGRVLDRAAYLEENLAPGTEIGQLSIRGLADVPVVTTLEVLGFAQGEIFPDTLTGAANPFAIDANGLMTVTGPVDYEAYASFALRVVYQDAGGNSYFDVIDITTLDVDDAPEVVAGPGFAAPLRIGNYVDTSADVLLGTLTTQDQDGSTGTVTFVLGGADADKFVVRGGQLFLKAGVEIDTGAPFDFDLTVRAEDSALPPGSGGTVDLDIGVITPDPLDALRWNYTAPATIRVFLAPGGVQATEIATLDDDVAPQGSYATLGWSAAQQARIAEAFAAFSDVLNLTFSFVTDLASADFALLLSQNSAPGSAAYWAVGGGTLALDGVQASLDGWGRFGASQLDGAGFAAGSRSYYALLHEIAHGLGMAHPHDTGGGSEILQGVNDPYDSYGDFDLNQAPYTLMSYNEQWETGPLPVSSGTGQGRMSSLGALDIGVLQAVYGANSATRAGNDTYDLPLSTATGSHFATLWDTGGSDTLRYTGSADATIDLRAATLDYSATGGGVVSYVAGIEGGLTIAAGVVIENATGGSGNDRLTGNAANNRLNGGAGNDTLEGGDGNDTLILDSTGDRALGGNGTDTAQSAVISLNLGAAALVDIENATLTGSAALNLTGSAIANRLTGNAGNNRIDGGAGNDTMTGGDGNDTLILDSTGDRANGGNGTDTAQSAVISISLRLSSLVDIENATLTGSAALNLTGNGLANRLIGNAGANRIDGGGGNDTMTGGAGADSFVFASTLGAGNLDRITDFDVTEDRILLDDAMFTGLARGALSATAFAANLTGNATDALHRILYETDTGRLFFDADGLGGQARVQFAIASAGLALTASDFLVI